MYVNLRKQIKSAAKQNRGVLIPAIYVQLQLNMEREEKREGRRK